MLGVLGCGPRIHAGLAQVTRMVLKALDFFGFDYRFYSYASGAFFDMYKRKFDTLLVMGGWYYPVYLIEDLLLYGANYDRLMGYIVAEGPVPKGLRHFFNHFDKIVAPSEMSRDFLSDVHDRPIRVIPHGIDTSVFKTTVEWEERPYDVCICIPETASPRLYRRKGIDIAQKVCDTLREEGLKIIGNRYAPRFVKGVEPFKSTEYYDLPKFYNMAKVFLLTSRSEGFVLPALEALACGCVVVYSDCPAHNEFLKGYGVAIPTTHVGILRGREAPNYYLVYESDPDDYVEAILSLLSDPEEARAISERGRRKALEFDYLNVYADLLSEVIA